MLKSLKFCYVTGGKNNFDFHAWLSDISIQRLKIDGCRVVILNNYM